ncbi:MAG: glutamate 5-kinase [Phycisphaerae bacterium]|nr:glutamate 5-kinase [Phycisphaerae bacterium]
MRNFSNAKRVVVKIGTNTLTKDGMIDTDYIVHIAGQIAKLLESGRQVMIVSSGAIGLGASAIGLEGAVTDMKMRQACAAVGQPLLMQEYRKAFAAHKIETAQVLLTASVLNHRKTYLNLRTAVDTLLNVGAVPVFNENDCVSLDEIGTAFGDNDTLSALVASKVDADLLIMLTDIDSLYDKDPKKYTDAKPVKTVHEITYKIVKSAGASGSKHATGGMKTKIKAAKIAANAGCRIVLANGRVEDVVTKIMAGDDIGTVFMPKQKLSNRIRWILNSAPAGTIFIDDGAVRALANHKSLLPSGIVSIKGDFAAGSVVMLNDAAKAVSSFSSVELAGLAGKHSSEIREILGATRRDVVAVPEDIVFLDN